MLNIIHHSLHDGQLPYGGAASQINVRNGCFQLCYRMSVASRGRSAIHEVSLGRLDAREDTEWLDVVRSLRIREPKTKGSARNARRDLYLEAPALTLMLHTADEFAKAA
jgi:hypothetical protein